MKIYTKIPSQIWARTLLLACWSLIEERGKAQESKANETGWFSIGNRLYIEDPKYNSTPVGTLRYDNSNPAVPTLYFNTDTVGCDEVSNDEFITSILNTLYLAPAKPEYVDVRLNDRRRAKVMKTDIIVGCQQFTHAKAKELFDLVEKVKSGQPQCVYTEIPSQQWARIAVLTAVANRGFGTGWLLDYAEMFRRVKRGDANIFCRFLRYDSVRHDMTHTNDERYMSGLKVTPEAFMEAVLSVPVSSEITLNDETTATVDKDNITVISDGSRTE